MNKYFNTITAAFILLVAGIVYILAKPKTRVPNYEPLKVQQATNFTKADNTVLIKVDAFTTLLQQAYKGIVVQNNSNNIIATLNNAGTVAKDFYNGNAALLSLNSKEKTFEIKNTENSLVATFTKKNGGVEVPTDVITAAMNKVYK